MPYTGDSISKAAEGLAGFSGGFLEGMQVGTQRELAQARMAMWRAELEDMQGQKQAQGEMLGMFQERAEAPAKRQVAGLQAGGQALSFLGLPVAPGFEEKAQFLNSKIQERVARVRDIGSRLSPEAARLFVQEKVQEIEADAMQMRADYFAEQLRDLTSYGLAPGLGGVESPRAQEFGTRAQEIAKLVQQGGVTKDSYQELADLRVDIAKDRDKQYQRMHEAEELSKRIATLTGPARSKALSWLAAHESQSVTFAQAMSGIDSAEKGEPTPQELYQGAVKAAEAEVGAMGGILPEGQTFDSLIEKHARRMSGQPEPQEQGQSWTPETIQQAAQAIAGGQMSAADADKLAASMPPEVFQAVRQAVQAMRQGATGGNGAVPVQKAQETPGRGPLEALGDVGKAIGGAGQGLMERVSEGYREMSQVRRSRTGKQAPKEPEQKPEPKEIPETDRKIAELSAKLARLKRARVPSLKEIKAVEKELEALKAQKSGG